MSTTHTLSEEDLRDIVKKHFAEKGQSVKIVGFTHCPGDRPWDSSYIYATVVMGDGK